MSVKFVTLRLNLDTDQHRRVWKYLNQQRAERGQSYSDTITRVLIKSVEDDGASELDIAGIIRNSAEQIARETGNLLRMTMPAFLAGVCIQGGNASGSNESMLQSEQKEKAESLESDTIPDDEIPWDYLGE